MGIAAEILGLRHKHFSSVTELLAALEQARYAPPIKRAFRVFLAGAAADLVLTNVAAHAAEALSELQSTNRKTRRTASPSRRKNRRSDQGLPTRQRILFRII
jgi:hypothetical protein